MHIIFNKVNNILTPFLRILKILGFRIFYLDINSKDTKDEIEISSKLKKLEIYWQQIIFLLEVGFKFLILL